MTSHTFTLGNVGRKAVKLDALTLVDNRMLGCANSGGGKSWMLRRLIEQVGPKVPVIVLDPEGEFSSLREKLDMVLCGSGGEVEATPRSAKLLCRKLMELRVSAVIDLYDLKLADRKRFVRLFLEALISLPRKLWDSTLIVLDEAHKFCPEKGHGSSEATEAVIDLMSQGRKRGYGGVLVTQRLSKLHKDAVGECNNVLLGRCTSDVDLKRANDILGLPTKDRSLRDLTPGEWFGFGPAFELNDIVRFTVGDVETTHPDPKNRHKFVPPKPSRKIKAVLGEFEGLEAQADEEARTEAELRAKVQKLEIALEKAQRAADRAPTERTVVDVDRINAAVERAVKQRDTFWEGKIQLQQRMVQKGIRLIEGAAATATEAKDYLESMADPLDDSRPEIPEVKKATKKVSNGHNRPTRARAVSNVQTVATALSTGDSLVPEGSARKILSALALFPDGLTTKRLGTITGLATRGGSYNTTMKMLRENEWIEGGRGTPLKITDVGLVALGSNREHIPEAGEERLNFWRGKVNGSAQKIFDAFIENYEAGGDGLTNDDIGTVTGLATRGGSYNTAMRQLKDYDVIQGRGKMSLNPDLLS